MKLVMVVAGGLLALYLVAVVALWWVTRPTEEYPNGRYVEVRQGDAK